MPMYDITVKNTTFQVQGENEGHAITNFLLNCNGYIAAGGASILHTALDQKAVVQMNEKTVREIIKTIVRHNGKLEGYSATDFDVNNLFENIKLSQ